MGVPASILRKLMSKAARTALSEGMVAKEVGANLLPGPLGKALMRQANLSQTTERGYSQLNRLRALMEGMAEKSRNSGSIPDHIKQMALLGQLSTVNDSVDGAWRKLMGGN